MTSVESGVKVEGVKAVGVVAKSADLIACPDVWNNMFEFLDSNELEKCELVCRPWFNSRDEDKKREEPRINPVRRFSSVHITRKYFGVNHQGKYSIRFNINVISRNNCSDRLRAFTRISSHSKIFQNFSTQFLGGCFGAQDGWFEWQDQVA